MIKKSVVFLMEHDEIGKSIA